MEKNLRLIYLFKIEKWRENYDIIVVFIAFIIFFLINKNIILTPKYVPVHDGSYNFIQFYTLIDSFLNYREFPYWQPFHALGIPFYYLSVQLPLLTPVNYIFYILPFSISYPVLFFLKISCVYLLNVFGCFLVFRYLLKSKLSALFCTIAMLFSMNYYGKLNSEALTAFMGYAFPYTVFFFVKYVDTRQIKYYVAMVFFMTLYFDFYPFYSLIAFFIFFLSTVIFTPKKIFGVIKSKRFFFATTILFLTSIIVLLPTILLYMDFNQDMYPLGRGDSTYLDLGNATSHSITIHTVLCLFFPKFILDIYSIDALGFLRLSNSHLTTVNFYYGIIPLLLTIFGLFFGKNRYKWPFVILSVFLMVYASGMNTPVMPFLFNNIKLLQIIRSITNFEYYIIFGFVFLAGCGLDRIIEKISMSNHIDRLFIITTFLILSFISIIAVKFKVDIFSIIYFVLMVNILIGILYVMTISNKVKTLAFTLLILIVSSDLIHMGHYQIENSSLYKVKPKMPGMKFWKNEFNTYRQKVLNKSSEECLKDFSVISGDNRLHFNTATSTFCKVSVEPSWDMPFVVRDYNSIFSFHRLNSPNSNWTKSFHDITGMTEPVIQFVEKFTIADKNDHLKIMKNIKHSELRKLIILDSQKENVKQLVNERSNMFISLEDLSLNIGLNKINVYSDDPTNPPATEYDTETVTYWEINKPFPHWIFWELKERKRIVQYTLQTGQDGIEGRDSTGRMPKDWRLEGSNDKLNWKILDIRNNQINWEINEKRIYDINNRASYKYYRLYISSGINPTILRLYKIRLLEEQDLIAPQDYKYEVTHFSYNVLRLRVEVPQDAFLYYSDMYDKHWESIVDKQKTEVYRANFTFKAIFLKKGSHTVEFRYNPKMFRYSLYLRIVFVILWILAILIWFSFFKGEEYQKKVNDQMVTDSL